MGEEKMLDNNMLKDEYYEELLPYIKDINVTDVNWNGRQLWIDDVVKGRYKSDIELQKEFIDKFSMRISNVVNSSFNKYTPVLEAETEDLRISIMHENVARTGRSISIRKTPVIKRIIFKDAIKDGNYCSEKVANLMSNAVKAKFNIVICGLPGVGKTELLKYLTSYIPDSDRVITIEDSLEIHYGEINPNKDCIELKVNNDTFTYTDAIKASLRQLPKWIMLSEARSIEVKYLLESISTGSNCMTTVHTNDVRKMPERIKSMMGSDNMADRTENEVYSLIDMAILISKKITPEGKIVRYIDQIATFDREDGENSCNLLVDESKFTSKTMQESLLHRMKVRGITEPYEYTFLKY